MIKTDTPYVIEVTSERVCISSDIVVSEAGIKFLEMGWAMPHSSGRHWEHQILGEVTGTGPWQIGDAVITEMTPDSRYWKYWLQWDEFRKSSEGKHLTSRDRVLSLLA